MFRALLAVCVLAAGAAQATPIGKTTQQKEAHAHDMVLPAPDGYCAVSSDHPADREMLSDVGPPHSEEIFELSIFADCGQLDAMRATDAGLSNYAMYIAPMRVEGASRSESRSEFVERLADMYIHADEHRGAPGTLPARIAEADLAIERQQTGIIGLIEYDGTAVFSGLLERTAIDDPEISAVVYAVTLISGQIVALKIVAPYEGRQTIDSLLARQHVNMQRLIAAN